MFDKKRKPGETALPEPSSPPVPVTEGKEKYQMAFPEGAAFDGIKCDLPGNFSIIKSSITLKEHFACGGNLLIDGGSVAVAEYIKVGGELQLSHTQIQTARVEAKKLVLRSVHLACDVDVDELILTAGSTITGKVKACKLIHVMPDCGIEGSINAPEVRFDKGARIAGQVSIGVSRDATDTPSAVTATSETAARP